MAVIISQDRNALDFERKILSLDPAATFYPKHPGRVRCGRCGDDIDSRKTRTYDVQRFQEHWLRGAKCKKRSSNPIERPITAFFSLVSQKPPPAPSPPARPVPSPNAITRKFPCPGLTVLDHKKIPVYLARCALPNGGAPPYTVLRARFQSEDPNSTPEQLERLIVAAQHHEARWINNHKASAVYSPNCQKHAFVSATGVIGCCATCLLVLSLKTFVNALNRPTPKHPKFTPKRYRNPILGECFLKHTDVYDLVVLVRSSLLIDLLPSLTHLF